MRSLLITTLVLCLGLALEAAQAKTRSVSVTPVQVILFPSQGNVPVGRLHAFILSSRMVAARLDKRESFQDLARRLRALYPSSSRYIALRLMDIDLTTGWALFHGEKDLPGAPSALPKTAPPRLASAFGYYDSSEWSRDWAAVLARFKAERRVASRLSPGMVIERELSHLEQENLAQLSGRGSRKMEVEKFTLGPLAANFKCAPGAVKLSESASHSLISGATAVSCKSSGASGVLGLRLDAGVLDFWANRHFNEAAQTQLLDDIQASAFENLLEESRNAENSTQAVCQKTKIADDNLEVHYCTRTLRSAPNFQDTVMIFGKRSRQRFIYTILRTDAMSEEGTKKVVESVLTALEENP
jgi:hypothetical protein